jgi:hypothetical protein
LHEKKDISPIINAEVSEGADNMDSDGEDTFLFLAPSYALGGPPPSLDGRSSIQGEDENPSAVGYREALRHRVYTIRRELPEVPMSSPLRKVLAPSDFMSCSGLVMDTPKGYNSFPESGHTKSALDFMNESISDFHSSKGTGNKYNGFWFGHFPLFKD